MKNLNFFIQNSSKLKKNQVRLIKLISILRYLNKNKLGYTQSDILNLTNFFLRKDDYREIKIKTLQKDLGFLTKQKIIYSFIIRLGEYKGTKIKYIPKKNANRLLRKLLNSTDELLEKTYNLIYKVNKEENEQKKIGEKNSSKNSSVFNTNINNINNISRKSKNIKNKHKKAKDKTSKTYKSQIEGKKNNT